jgi:hypothetical protein
VFHKAKKHQRSLVTASQIALLKTHIIQPSRELRITPEYVMDLLLYYLEHKGAEGKRHLAGHFYGTRLPLFRSLPVFVWCMRSQSCITTRLISDDILIERIAPNEETRLLLGNAMARFAEKYSWNLAIEQPSRSFWFRPYLDDVFELVEQRG